MKRLKGICLLILIIALLSGCGYHSQTSYSYSGNVTVTLGMGNRNLLVEGKKVPVEVVVSGDYADERHKVALNVPTNKEDYFCYQKAIGKSREDTVVFLVPVAAKSSQMVVEILNENDQVIYSRTCSYQFAPTEGKDGEIVIGMIGVEQENNIWNFSSAYGEKYYLFRTVKIQPEHLPALWEAYDSYSMIVINTEMAEEIAEAQMNAISEWAARGGTLLLIGNGQNAKDLGFSLKNRVKTAKLDTGGYINGYECRAGIVWIMGKHIFKQERPDGEQLSLLDVLLNGRIDREAQFAENRKLFAEALINGLEWQGSTGITADRGVYPGIFCVYLVIIIPGIYLVLRRRDRMHLFRISICVTACMVSLIIWVAGSKTRFSRPFLHSIGISSFDHGTERQDIYISIQAPYNQSYQAGLTADYEMNALQKEDHWNGEAYSSYDRQTVSMEANDEIISLKFGNMTAFTPQYFELDRELPSELGISGQAGVEYYGPDGELTNDMQTDLYQAAILIGNRVILLDTWSAGETIDLQYEIQHRQARVMSVEQFLAGAYQSWEMWGTEYGELYEVLLEREAYRFPARGCVMARREAELEIQYGQEYQQKEASFIIAGIETKEEP